MIKNIFDVEELLISLAECAKYDRCCSQAERDNLDKDVEKAIELIRELIMLALFWEW